MNSTQAQPGGDRAQLAILRQSARLNPAPTAVLTRTGGIVLVNSAFERMFGPERVLRGAAFEDLIPAPFRTAARRARIDTAERSAGVFQCPSQPIDRLGGAGSTGGRRALVDAGEVSAATWTRWHLHVPLGADGMIVAVGTDVSREQALEARLEVLEDRLRAAEDRQRQYDQLLEQLPVGIVVRGRDGHLQKHNRKAIELLGTPVARSMEEARFAGMKLCSEDERPCPSEQLPISQALRGNFTAAKMLAYRRPDGDLRYFRVSAGPIRDASGAIAAGVVVFSDVSDQKRAEEVVRSRERLLTTVVDVLPVGVWITDARGNVVQDNAAGARMWGNEPCPALLAETPLKGWRLGSLTPLERDEWPLARALERGEACLQEAFEIERVDGARAAILHSALPLFDEKGEISGAIAVMEDFSALHDAEDRLKLALRVRDEMLGVVSHDLKNPLSSIVLSAESLLRRAGADQTMKRRLESMVQTARRMSRLIDGLLDMTCLQAGMLTLNRVPCCPRSLLEEAVEQIRPLLGGMSLAIEAPGALPDVSADRDRILQVLSNLLGNAIKFTPPDGAILVSARESEAKEIIFTVQDSGVGIDADAVSHIFERFWRADQTDRRGQGLGLAIAKAIVEGHGGRISVDSLIGKGTKVSFTVPVAWEHAEPVAQAAGEAGPKERSNRLRIAALPSSER